MLKQLTTLVLSLTIVAGAAQAQQHLPIQNYDARFHPVYAANGMVASQEALASEVGMKILQKGGNAVDAAVAVGYALAVTLPRAGNIGGGGFMMVHLAEEDKTIAIDYREMAPKAATRDMFLDAEGKVDTNKSRNTVLAAGVPGTVAGLNHALEKYGTLSLPEVVAPAISLAENGIPVTYDMSWSLLQNQQRLSRSRASTNKFFKPLGTPYIPGELWKQPLLALTLKQISQQGTRAFYKGEIADKIVATMEKQGGLITKEDLANYEVKERTPVLGTYRGFKVASMPPPSSGGVHLVQMLNMLESFPLQDWGAESADTIHAMAETMKLAYADRAKHLGDPDFVDVPVMGLTSKAYAKKLAKTIDMNIAKDAQDVAAGDPLPYESTQTTHFSVMDGWGNTVSNTYTLNFSYGNGYTVNGAGFLLNNEMDDFSAKPGTMNAYGLVGGEANSVEAGKRPLSSMTPSIVFKDGKPVLATGSPGGSRIITTVLQTIVNVVDHKMDIASATAAPRVHHQWLPDELRIESGLSPDTIKLLEEKGHRVIAGSPMGSVQSVMWDGNMFMGASDPRRPGALAIGY